jgi:enoyl-CoA hydratase
MGVDELGLPEYEVIQVTTHDDGAIVQVQLDRAPVNALTHQSYLELVDCFRRIDLSPLVCAVVLGGTGRMFSAGADLDQVRSSTTEQAARRHRDLRAAAAAIACCRVPVVGALHGAVVGAGAILAAGCDFLYAADDCFFVLPEIDEGIIGGAAHLSRILPVNTVRHMALTAERLHGPALLQLGAVQKLVARSALETVALKTANELAERGPDTVRLWKEALSCAQPPGAGTGLVIEQGLSHELAVLASARRSGSSGP